MTIYTVPPFSYLAVVLTFLGCSQKPGGLEPRVIWQSVQDSNVQQLTKCVEMDPSLVNVVDLTGNSLLYEAVGSLDIKIIKYLLVNGAKVNHRNQFGRTPLHRAADEDRQEVVRLLIDHGAEVNARDCRGSTPLIAAAEFAGLSVLELLVESGADVPSGNHYGRSALHNAAKREDTIVAEYLISQGAKLNQVCEYGTPLDLTANFEVAELLRAAGGVTSRSKTIASRTHEQYLTGLPSER